MAAPCKAAAVDLEEKAQLSQETAIDIVKPHSVFSDRAKKAIIFTASMGAFFSPLSANIYMPALTTIANDLNISNSQINLTVTTYLIFQGIAPSFIGNFSDTTGRRPAYIVCFTIYIIANIALALNNSYAGLLALRCLQSSGSSGTVALATAVVADVLTSSERGTYVGYASMPSILGPALSPILGGVISAKLGWHWIFWFLLIFTAAYLVPFLMFFPETCRKVVDDGSVLPPPSSWSLLNVMEQRKARRESTNAAVLKARIRKPSLPNPLATLVIVTDKEAALLLISNGLLYACYSAINVSTTSQFEKIYGFNSIQISLMYLPICGGSILSVITTGRFLNWNYRRHAQRLGITIDHKRQQDLTNFPIERARLEVAMPVLYLAAVTIIAYGWVMSAHVNIAGPCILLFLIGYALIAGNNCTSILMVDYYRHKPATATAANNLVRCLMGAAATAVINPMIEAMGIGWAITMIGLLWIAVTPLLWMLMRWGPRWREEKTEKPRRRNDSEGEDKK
ncbi:major facilitator superfamily transporter [Saitoella complicata NRRL Y-17804]|uniref:Major facilitator superfamily (MFS) profile domain-containing protein n=1 Tax=Saitoella complicata (strain BCRC 22490 / CBS 7301 / JCM 7358 / NBRC 10748 / NRRL Y-17804) TaxID=698492 RepID=A0A0E9NKX3_SAICN|nr:major facilitator superfamily transporter [Saitoella complicata NRRL Y-17804]ODQ54865.1 major facilitator superfamily transporter [Saitoella complicata NRRL Y-17804]GAO50527.1 hypothetical protein G7K_4651-t1 [Saitoella complicata NRRL Y-17804]